MIRVEVVTAEFALTHCQLDPLVPNRSKVIWGVTINERLVIVCGVIQTSLLGPGEVWLYLLERSRAVLKACRRLMIYPRQACARLQAHVANEVDRRFAEFCGFEFVKVDLFEGEAWARGEIG